MSTHTPLHYAVFNKNVGATKILLKSADVGINIQDNYGLTPLHKAVQDNSKEIVKYLLDGKDIDINIKDNNNLTPLDWAEVNKNKEIIELMRSNGVVDSVCGMEFEEDNIDERF